MKNGTLLGTILGFALLPALVRAQLPPVCPNANAPLTKTCAQACVLCELDGYSSTTTQTIPGQAPLGFCTFVVHSMGWIGFVAGSADLIIQVDVGGCTLGNSIEMGIYQSDDCQTMTLVSNCNTAMFQFTSNVFVNTEPLMPGCHYYLVFDNNGPASCPFTVQVLSGSAAAPVLPAPAVPSGPTQVCPGAVATYTIPPLFGACDYVWTAPPGTLINGVPGPVALHADEGTSVTVQWGATGGNLCVRGRNACHTSPQSCLPVSVNEIPPTILPTEIRCANDPFEWIDGIFYGVSGLLSITYQTPLGCDSVVQQQLIVQPPIITPLGLNVLCPGECLEVGGQNYCTSGAYSTVLTSELGCDSLVTFSVFSIPLQAVAATDDTLNCFSGNAVLDGSASTPGSSYFWYNAAGTLLAQTVNTTVTNPGLYALVVQKSSAGNTCTDTAWVQVPVDTLAPLATATGGTLSCLQDSVVLTAAVSPPNATFSWTGPNGFLVQNSQPAVDFPGAFVLNVVAPNGCAATDTAAVLADQAPPQLLVSGGILNCLADSILIAATLAPAGSTGVWTGPDGFFSQNLSPLVGAPGDYLLTATGPNGCTATATAAVALDQAPPSVTATGGILTCLQDSLTLSGTVFPANSTAAWTGPNGFFSQNMTPEVGLPGVYTLTATAGNGCTATTQTTVSLDNTPPQVAATGGLLTCLQDTLPLAATVVPANCAINWTGPGGFSSTVVAPAVFAPGDYTLLATAPNGCSAMVTVTVLADQNPPLVVAAGDTLTCLQDSVALPASATPVTCVFSWSGPNGFVAQIASPLVGAPGLYALTVTDLNGCSATADATVFADQNPPQLTATGGVLNCLQDSVALMAVVAPANCTLDWSGPNGFFSQNPAPAVGTPGVYTLTATAPNGCSAQASAVVASDENAPQLAVTGGTLTCLQDSLVLTAAVVPANCALSWTGPNGFSTQNALPTVGTPGTYLLTAIAPNGCSATASATVLSDVDPPLLTATGGILTCLQNAVALTTTILPGNSSILWTGPGGFISQEASPVVSVPGIYILTVTAPNGCVATVQATVTADQAAPQVSAAGGTLTCQQNTLQLTSAVLPANCTLNWSGPNGYVSQDTSPAVSTPGMYTLLATAPNGCTAAAQATVLADADLPQVAATGGTVNCLLDSVALTAAVTPLNCAVVWTGPNGFVSQNAAPVVTMPGMYTLTATAPNGCSADATAIVLTDLEPPVVAVSGGTLSCLEDSLLLAAVVAPSDCAIIWTGPNGFSTQSPNPFVTSPGDYLLTATAPNGCQASAVATVLADASLPQVTAAGGVLTCLLDSIALAVSVTPADCSIFWTGPNGFYSQNPASIVTAPGLYTVLATAPNGCSASGSALITADQTPPWATAAGGTLDCVTPGITIVVQTDAVAVSWAGPGGFSSEAFSPEVLLAGVYAVTATAANGCTDVATAEVLPNPGAPVVQIAGDTINCVIEVGALTAFSPTPGVSFTWNGPDGFEASGPTTNGTLPGTYQLTATAPNGCMTLGNAIIFADTMPPRFLLAGDTLTCAEPVGRVSVSFLSALTPGIWEGPGQFTSAQQAPVVFDPGTYQFTATGANGCSASAQVEVVEVERDWMLELGPDLTLDSGQTVTLNAITDLPADETAGILWTFPPLAGATPCTCLTPGFRPLYSGWVQLELVDVFGCRQVDRVWISLIDREALYVPNAFSPDGDGENDWFEFFIGAQSGVANVRDFQIFDRWGELVHRRQNFLTMDTPAAAWNGSRRGRQAEAGVYVWYLELEYADGSIRPFSGDVLLLR